MKKSSKLLCVLLALVMVVSLLPGMAFAADAEDADPAAETEGIGDIIDVIGGITLPTYTVSVFTNKGIPAVGATITLTDQVTGESLVYKTDFLGTAVLKAKSLTAIYTVSATWESPILGIKYISLPGITWTASIKPEWETIKVYPVPNIGLNYTDHTAYVNGYPDGLVRPLNNITRAEAAAIIYRIAKPGSFSTAPNTTFTDIKGHWAYTEISALANAGIIKGTSATTFSPDRSITRGELFTMIGRMFADTYTTDGTIGSIFKDIGSGYFVNYIELLYKLGLVEGDGNGLVRPTDPITRAETVTLVNRLLLRQPDSESCESCENVKYWPDNPKGAWYYAAIQEATNSHDYTLTVKLNPLTSEEIFCEVWTKTF